MTWPEVALGDIAELAYGKNLPKKIRDGGSFSVFGSNGQVGSHSEHLTEGATIIIGRKGSIGEINFSNEPCWPIDTTYYVDNSKSECDLRWLYYCLKQLRLKDLNKATGIPGLNRNDAYERKIVLPPLEEQKRIAAILDQADAIVKKRQAALNKLNTLGQSIFYDMFGSNSDFRKYRFEDSVEFIQIGPFGSLLHKSDYIEGGVPLINPKNIVGGKIIADAKNTVAKDKYKDLSRYHMKYGDIVMGRRGEMGRCAIVSEQEDGYLCGTGSLFIRPKKGVLNSTYIQMFLSSPQTIKYLETEASGVTMLNLNAKSLKKMEVSIPPQECLDKFANLLRAVSNENQDLLVSNEVSKDLFASLQQRAFRGEL